MMLHQWLGLSAVVLIVGFAIFAFRQGSKVKPDRNNENRGPSVGYGTDSANDG